MKDLDFFDALLICAVVFVLGCGLVAFTDEYRRAKLQTACEARGGHIVLIHGVPVCGKVSELYVNR